MNRRTRNTMHELRKNLKVRCIVCGSEPYQRCSEPAPEVGQQEWAEFKVLAAVRDLKEVDPDSLLVMIVEAALSTIKQNNPDQTNLDLSQDASEEQK